MSQATTKSILLSGLHCSTGPDQLAERQLDYKILEATRIMDNAGWTLPALIILTTGCSPWHRRMVWIQPFQESHPRWSWESGITKSDKRRSVFFNLTIALSVNFTIWRSHLSCCILIEKHLYTYMIGDPDRSRILASSLHSGTPPPFIGYRRNGLFNENEVINSRNSGGTDAAFEYAGLVHPDC